MADLDKPIASFVKGLDSNRFVEGAEKVTLHSAMIMSSGVRVDEEKWDELEKNPDTLKGERQVQAYFEYSEPISSQDYKYQYSDPALMMQVLNAVVPGSAKDFIKKELLDKLGIVHYSWEPEISGLPNRNYHSRMTSRNMLKWGTLVSNKGKWRGEQLISQVFLNKAIHTVTDPGHIFFITENVTNAGYGYFWWQADLKVGDKTYFSTSAQGGGGQYIILIEELDLIVVATGHRMPEDPARTVTTLQLTAEHILPVFIQ